MNEGFVKVLDVRVRDWLLLKEVIMVELSEVNFERIQR